MAKEVFQVVINRRNRLEDSQEFSDEQAARAYAREELQKICPKGKIPEPVRDFEGWSFYWSRLPLSYFVGIRTLKEETPKP